MTTPFSTGVLSQIVNQGGGGTRLVPDIMPVGTWWVPSWNYKKSVSTFVLTACRWVVPKEFYEKRLVFSYQTKSFMNISKAKS